MNDPKLKLAMARLLPDKIFYSEEFGFCWKPEDKEQLQEQWLSGTLIDIRETEWLYVLHLVEQTLEDKQFVVYEELVYDSVVQSMPLTNLELEGIMRSDIKTAKGYIRAISATFTQRATAMCKVKGIEE